MVIEVLEELLLQILYGAVEAAWCYGVVLSIGHGVEYLAKWCVRPVNGVRVHLNIIGNVVEET